jgi:hypothetical protein
MLLKMVGPMTISKFKVNTTCYVILANIILSYKLLIFHQKIDSMKYIVLSTIAICMIPLLYMDVFMINKHALTWIIDFE